MSGPRPQIDDAVNFQIGRSMLVARRNLHLALENGHFNADARARYQIGQGEYNYEYRWMEWPDIQFEGETYVEMLDSVIYPAMAEVARVRRGD